jgi:hypothetical protein
MHAAVQKVKVEGFAGVGYIAAKPGTRLPIGTQDMTKTTIARFVLLAQVPYVFLRYRGFAVALDA